MDAVVPAQVSAELIQILSNLVLGDNEIRASAEKAVDDRLAQSPELYLLALAQSACSADTEVMRSFSLVLLRRLLLRASTPATPNSAALTLYDQLPSNTLSSIERLLLHTVAHEPATVVRRKAVDTVIDVANKSMERGRPWHALQVQAFAMAQAAEEGARESAYLVFAGCPVLVLDLQTNGVLELLQKGLQDAGSVDVRHAALRASVAYLLGCDDHQSAQSVALMHPILETLPSLPPVQLSKFLQSLLPLGSSRPHLFAPHLRPLLSFLAALLLSSPDVNDPGPTPTVGRPFPGGGASAFEFPPASAQAKGKAPAKAASREDDEREDARKAALEFVVSLSEARPGMVRKVEDWSGAIVRGCLEGMGELDDDETEAWLEADPSEDPTDDSYPHVYEQSLDRLACAVGGKHVLPPAFQYIPAMLASHDWRHRHAGLMAIAALGEGTANVMKHELGKVVDLVTPAFHDSHPRVRYAACQCVGQLCTDLEEIIQEQYHQQLFAVLIPTLDAPEPRVHSHAAAALINFCEGVEHDTLVPYLDPIVERLLKLLHSGTGVEQGREMRRYVQEQAITTLAMVADASETTFAKHYSSIMPLLLDALQNANGPDYRKLRSKAMECAGLIAIAVGRDVFRPDASRFIELLMRIQNAPADPADTMLGHYLIATWAKVCQAMGPDFEPYLPVVMPPLLQAAAAKAEVSVYTEDEALEDKEGWETIQMDGQQIGIRTSAIEEKCQAFETLVIHCSTLGARFAPYLMQSLELSLPALRFNFHDGVREAAAMLIPMLLSSGKNSSTLTQQMVSATFTQLVNCIGSERDPSFVSSLYKCFTDCLRTVGGPGALPQDFHAGAAEATKRQLHALAERRRRRSRKTALEIEDEREDLALHEEMEDFALEDMEKMLRYFDPAHPLLIAVSSVRELGLGLAEWDEDGDAQAG